MATAQSFEAQPSLTAPVISSTSDHGAKSSTGIEARLLPAEGPMQAVGSGRSSAGPAAIVDLETQNSGRNAQPILNDGRIKNPVPSKLKGKTDNVKGEFGVMQMDLRANVETLERDALARRTSERTEMAAKMAFKNGYVSLRRSRFVHHPDAAPPSLAPAPAAPPPAPPAPKSSSPRVRPSPEAIKVEQARLLTLLRTLDPLSVVNQICRALAFFGGIPGAAPDPNGFPESAQSNGSGSLFVGWISEIFPNLENDTAPTSTSVGSLAAPGQTSKNLAAERRPRGRPKGSKASKFRSDKGVKKGPKKLLGSSGQPQDGVDVDDSWVDEEDVTGEGQQSSRQELTSIGQSTPVRTSSSFQQIDLTSSGKKRGRPKGSKNRPKDATGAETTLPRSTPVVIHAPAPVASGAFSIGKKKKGRPKGSKNRPKEANAQEGSGAPPNEVTDTQAAGTSSESAVVADSIPFSGTDYALAALRQALEEPPIDNTNQTTSFQPVNTTAVESSKSTSQVSTTKKRKRKSGQVGVHGQGTANPAIPATQSQPVPNGTPLVSVVNHETAQTTSKSIPPSAAAAVPPPKRQRKAKEPRASSKQNQANARGARGSGTATAPKSIEIPSNLPPTQRPELTSPTIEELEAQLEQQSPSPQLQHAQPPQQSHPAQYSSQQASQQPSQQPSHSQQVHQSSQRSDQRQAVLSRQQQHQPYQQRQQQTVAQMASPSLGQVNTASPRVSQAQSRSPNPNQGHSSSPNISQQHMSKTQQSSSGTNQAQQSQQQQVRGSQSYFSQNRSAPSQYGQQSQQHQTAQYSTQQQQTYSPQQQAQYPAQQSKQQGYITQPQQQYPSQQQQYPSQQGLQQQSYATTSAGASSQTLARQSPQFGAATTSSYNPGDANFRSNMNTGLGFSNSTFGSRRTTAGTPANNSYQTSGAAAAYGSSGQQSSSYGARTALPTSASQRNPVQNVQNVQNLSQNMQEFHGFPDTTSLFDMSNLDSQNAGHSALNLGSAPYNMGAGNVPRTSGNPGSFGTPAMTNFDTNLGGNDRYFGVGGRR